MLSCDLRDTGPARRETANDSFIRITPQPDWHLLGWLAEVYPAIAGAGKIRDFGRANLEQMFDARKFVA